MRGFIFVVVVWISTLSMAWGEPPQGRWVFRSQGGVSMMTQDVGNGNGVVTKGRPGPVLNGRILYKITDNVAFGIGLEWEEHLIKNVSPIPLEFGRSKTLFSMAVFEIYHPLWPSLRGGYPITPYGFIGIGQNNNSFKERDSFSQNCTPASACLVSLQDTLGIKVAAGIDYSISPRLSINAEIGWKLNSGKSHISTTDTEGNITNSPDGYQASAASLLIGIRYNFGKPKLIPVPIPQLTPEIEALPPPIESEPACQNFWVEKDILFESSSWSISSEQEAFLLEIAPFLNCSPKMPINIEGNTDLHGSKEENMSIAQKRAEAVAQVLTKAGVTNTMQIISYGDSRPLSTDETSEADRMNRRVTIRRLVPGKE